MLCTEVSGTYKVEDRDEGNSDLDSDGGGGVEDGARVAVVPAHDGR